MVDLTPAPGDVTHRRVKRLHVWVITASWAALALLFVYAAAMDFGGVSVDVQLLAFAAVFAGLSVLAVIAGGTRGGLALSAVCALAVVVWLGTVAFLVPSPGVGLDSVIGFSIALIAAGASLSGLRANTNR